MKIMRENCIFVYEIDKLSSPLDDVIECCSDTAEVELELDIRLSLWIWNVGHGNCQ